MKPGNDLCLKCQKDVHILTRSGNLEEEEKAEKIQNYQEHIPKLDVRGTIIGISVKILKMHLICCQKREKLEV